MLATNPVVGIPDPLEADMAPQVINVPVRPRRHLLMVRDSRPHTSRPQGAAHVNVETSSKLERAEFPNSDQLSPGTKKDQSVGAAFCCYDRPARLCRRNCRHGVSGFKSETQI